MCPFSRLQEGRCKATWKREIKLPWREAGPPNHHDDKVDSDQKVVNKEIPLSLHDSGTNFYSIQGKGLEMPPANLGEKDNGGC